ncbi:hypothetical protein LAZ67_10000938 [Cordylochernes scorpioides]|uniref:Ycf15 n=1 Tax=Cordylochernes scorpioides TaxID=51811 RepID=A0ABY6L0C9_9ARAC|nr:hypothetical protein LAZ67_10000938 [Cordylochernes scorpioides]
MAEFFYSKRHLKSDNKFKNRSSAILGSAGFLLQQFFRPQGEFPLHLERPHDLNTSLRAGQCSLK